MLWFKKSKSRKNQIKSEIKGMIKYDVPKYLDTQYKEMLSSVDGYVKYDKYEGYILAFEGKEYRFGATDLLLDALENMQKRYEEGRRILMIP